MKEKINGPYFLRAANIWRRIEKWCKSEDSGIFGDKLLETFVPGTPRANGRFLSYKSKSIHALEAIFAFYDGQKFKKDFLSISEDNGIALFGGYIAYDQGSFMRLCTTDDAKK